MNLSFDQATGKYSFVSPDGKTYASINKSYLQSKCDELWSTPAGKIPEIHSATVQEFSINERFTFLEKLVHMVATGIQCSGIVTGRGGLGKSYTITKTLENMGYTDISGNPDFQTYPGQKVFRTIKGFSTPRAFYEALYNNNGIVLICDDVDSLQKDKDTVNLLKAALDSYSKRIVCWCSASKNEEIPNSFEYTGRIITISNMHPDQFDQALRTRSMMIDLSMTKDEIVERMEFIAKSSSFMPDMDYDFKMDAINFIKETKDSTKELSLRTLISVVKIRSTCDSDWKNLAKYLLS